VLASILKLHTGLSGFEFSSRIAAKYAIFRKPVYLPALIFLRLFDTSIIKKITNINRTELINHYFRLYFNNYFKMISQIALIPSYYYPKYIRITTVQSSNKYSIATTLTPPIKQLTGFAGSKQKTMSQSKPQVLITRQAISSLSLQVLGGKQRDRHILYFRSLITPFENRFYRSNRLEYLQFKSGSHFSNVITKTRTLKQTNLSLAPPIFWHTVPDVQSSNKYSIATTFIPNIKWLTGFTGSREEAGFQPNLLVSITSKAPKFLSLQALSREQRDKEMRDFRSLITPFENRFYRSDSLEYLQFKSGSHFSNVITKTRTLKQTNLSLAPPIFWHTVPDVQSSNKYSIATTFIPNIKWLTGFTGSREEAGFQPNLLVSITSKTPKFLSLQALSREQRDKILDSRFHITPLEDKFHRSDGLKMALLGKQSEVFGIDTPLIFNNNNFLKYNVRKHSMDVKVLKPLTTKISLLSLVMARRGEEKETVDELFGIHTKKGNIYKYLRDIVQEKALSDLKNAVNNKSTTELILRKPVTQNANIVSKTIENLQTEKTTSIKILDTAIKESSKIKIDSTHEINMIADKVYKIIEKRIAIEKERRGWR